MRLILMIAWRNLLRHKAKSLVIGAILFLGSLLMTVGNGIISGMDQGIEQNIINGFLGDLVILSQKQKSDNVLLDMMGSMIEPITNYPQIKRLLLQQSFIDRFLPVGKNMAMALSEDINSMPGYAYLLGVDFAAYQRMFPHSLKAIEGRLLLPDERGILVPKTAREEFYNYTNFWLIPEDGRLIEANLNQDARQNLKDLQVADNVVLMGMSEDNSSTDLRFRVKGIIQYQALNTIFGHFTIADIESYRECLGYFSATDQQVAVSKEDQTLLHLENQDLDSLFATQELVVANNRRTPPVAYATKASTKSQTPVDVESGAYNLIFVKLKSAFSADQVLKKLNQVLAQEQTGTRVVTWKKASGVIGSLTSIIKGSLLLFVSFLFLVAVIIIINTLTMAALERTSEIGMMRAIGAQKNFIRTMFFGEIGTLAGIFGGAGLLVGLISVNIIAWMNITSSNDLVQLLFGGDTFQPLLRITDILMTLIELAVVTLIAALYPVKIASSIKPLDAVIRD